MATSPTHDSLTPFSGASDLPVRTDFGPLPHLMRGVWLQSLRRNETFVLFILLGIYALGALLLRIVGIEGQAGAHFVSGLGLQLGSLLASLIVIISAARLIPEELDQRTIYPVLAKPVSRAQVVVGKFLPVVLIGMAAMALFSLATLLLAPHPEYQSFAVLAQALVVKVGSLAMLAGLAMFASLYMPPVLAMLVAGLVAFGGGFISNLAIHALGTGQTARIVSGLLPDFAMLNLFPRYNDGGATLGIEAFTGMILYAALWTAIFLGGAIRRFQRMEL